MKKILVVPDLHVGSIVAPSATSVKPGSGSSDKLRNYLYVEFCKLAYDKQWDLVIVNGDVCDGVQIEENVWSIDMESQLDMAKRILSPIKTKKWLFTLGTPFHSNYDVFDAGLCHHTAVAEETLAKTMGGVYEESALFEMEGYVIHAAHTLDHNGTVVEQLAKDIGVFGADLVIRSHRHEYAYIETSKGKGVCTPCWQFNNTFGVTHGMFNKIDIGLVEIHLDDDIRVVPRFVDMEHFYKPKSVMTMFGED